MDRPDLDYLVESIPNPLHGANNRPSRWLWFAPIFPLLFGAGGTYLCYHAVGMSLGLFLGGLFWAALLTTPLAAGESTLLGNLFVALGMIVGVASVWMFAAAKASFPLNLVAQSIAVLAAYVLAISAVTAFISRGRLARVGGAVVALISLAWFFWPIWMSPLLTTSRGQQLVEHFVPVHPVFATNARLLDRLGYWAEQPTAYHNTSLSDDVSYTLPTTIWPCVLLHGGIAIAAWLLTLITRRRVKVGLPAA